MNIYEETALTTSGIENSHQKYKFIIYKNSLRSFMQDDEINLAGLSHYYQTYYQISNLKFLDFVKNIFFYNNDLLDIDKLMVILNFLLNGLNNEFPKLKKECNREK